VYLLAAGLHDAWKAVQAKVMGAGGGGGPGALRVRDVIAARRAERQRTYSLPADASAHDALTLMLAEGVTAVVVEESGAPAGLFTQNDFLRRVAMPELPARASRLRELMTPLARTTYVLPDNDIPTCLAALAAANVHHLPVFTDTPPAGTLVGVVSLPELLGLSRELRDAHAAMATALPVGLAASSPMEGGGQLR